MTAKVVGREDKMVWDENKVKDLLPNVWVKIGRKEFYGKVMGRQMPMAEVYLSVPIEDTGVKIQIAYPWSWAAIVRSLNEGRALEI